MKNKWNILRILRIVVAGLVFAASWGAVWFFPETAVIFTAQYGSSVLELLAHISWGAVIAVISITLITFLIGRIYCSVLCPLGIMQDVLALFPRKYKFNQKTKIIKYPVFLFCAALFLTGFILPLTWLMPSANFVQIVNYGFRETAFLSGLTERSTHPAVLSMIVAWGIFVLLIILVRWRGRIYCNTLCPVGTVLGLISRYSLCKIKIDQSKCVSCGACERTCKAGCIDAKNKIVNNADCVMCMNCLTQCKFDALKMGRVKTEKAEIPGRRAFLINGGALAGGAAAGLVLGKTDTPSGTVMPPGAMDRDQFNSNCLGCGLCISACEGNVLRPALTQYGLRGFMQPYLDFNKGECRFNCNRCSEICPCGALKPLSLTEKRQLRIGIARYKPDRCVAFAYGQDCGACAEHCPVGALTMVSYKETTIPKVNEKLCIGCGACQQICPVETEKPISVQGVAKQIFVEKPKKEETVKLEAEEDFPF